MQQKIQIPGVAHPGFAVQLDRKHRTLEGKAANTLLREQLRDAEQLRSARQRPLGVGQAKGPELGRHRRGQRRPGGERQAMLQIASYPMAPNPLQPDLPVYRWREPRQIAIRRRAQGRPELPAQQVQRRRPKVRQGLRESRNHQMRGGPLAR